MNGITAFEKIIQKRVKKIQQLFRFSNELEKNEKKPIHTTKSQLKKSELHHLMGMDYERFSHLLPYRYYDEEDELFINTESLGFGCEIAPLSGANEEIINSLSDMIKNKLDHTVCVQVMLFSSNKIGSILESNLSGYVTHDNTFKEIGLNQYHYLKHAAIHGFDNKRQMTIPLRDYRCFLFISKRTGYTKSQAIQLCELRDEITTELKNTGIHHAKLSVTSFIRLVSSLINHDMANIYPEKHVFDKYKELHQQMVDPDFDLRVSQQYLSTSIGAKADTQIVALSLKKMPEEIALWSQADHFANIFKPNIGIPCPFVISVHFKCERQGNAKMKAFRKASSLEKKANSPYAKLIPGTVQAAQDWKKIRDELASDAIKLCRVYYNCILFTDEENRRDHVSKTIAAFRINGMELYGIKRQQLQSYLALMPFLVEEGLWSDLSMLDRLNTMTSWNLTNLLPLVAEYKGEQSEAGLFAPTFRHQIASINNFNQRLDNYNVCICATSGSGKSVLSQSMIASVLAQNGKAWVIDVGESYQKFCETLGGTYMDASNLRLNPFSCVKDISQSSESIRDLISVMASPNEGLGDVQKAHLLDAVTDAYNKKGKKANIDDVILYLESIDQSQFRDLRINDIVTLLNKYSPTRSSKESIAARIFNEASLLETDDFQKERLVVLELKDLESQPDLLKSVLFALILNIETQMYSGNRSRKKLCVIDEAWRLLNGSNAVAAGFIEKGFRTARKNNGSFSVISQQIGDFFHSSEAQAAWACSENKIIMRQNEKEFKNFVTKYPDYFNEYQQELIKNFKESQVNGFSEFMVQQGSISSFHRLFLDPFSRVMFSSRAEEHQAVNNLISKGHSVSDSIKKVAESLYGNEIKKIYG